MGLVCRNTFYRKLVPLVEQLKAFYAMLKGKVCLSKIPFRASGNLCLSVTKPQVRYKRVIEIDRHCACVHKVRDTTWSAFFVGLSRKCDVEFVCIVLGLCRVSSRASAPYTTWSEMSRVRVERPNVNRMLE